MKDQKLVVGHASKINAMIEPLLLEGWRIMKIACESVATGSREFHERGYVIILLEK